MNTEKQKHTESIESTDIEEKDSPWSTAGVFFLIGLGLIGLNGLSIWLTESWYPVVFGLGVLSIIVSLIAFIMAMFNKMEKS